jgi:putative component of toxin-antitoxin plasmid stabilization module
MIAVREYLDNDGQRPYANWFDVLDAAAAAKVATAVTRIGQGNFSNGKSETDAVAGSEVDSEFPNTSSDAAAMENS